MEITTDMLEYSWTRFTELARSLNVTIGYTEGRPPTSDPKRACEKAVGDAVYASIDDPIERVETVIATEYVPVYEQRAASEAAASPKNVRH